MNASQVVTDPAALALEDLTSDMSSTNLNNNDSAPPPKLVLSLLQPLANPEMLALCRNPASRFITMSDGRKSATTNSECLNLAPLNRAWRQAISKAPPRAEVVFDIRLPVVSDPDAQKVYWIVALPRGGGLGIEVQHVMTMALTIATGLRMRVKGECRFGVVYEDEGKRFGEGSMLRFERELINLAESKFGRRAGDDEEAWVAV